MPAAYPKIFCLAAVQRSDGWDHAGVFHAGCALRGKGAEGPSPTYQDTGPAYRVFLSQGCFNMWTFQDTSWPWVAIGGVAVATAVILASGGLRKETGKACLGCPIWATPVI
eukprot:symbB.v1.2.033797.t1/scaffold4250.1/size42417/2